MGPTFSLLTICGLEELESHAARGVTHVLSILDPDWPDPEAFRAYASPHRLTLRFHDIIQPTPGQVLPEREHVERILAFGDEIARDERRGENDHLLIHCHAGISRSTAAMTMLLAQAHPEASETDITRRVLTIRDKTWPNARMIGFADELLGRGGRLSEAVRHIHGHQIAIRPHLADTMRGLGRGREVDAAILPKAA